MKTLRKYLRNLLLHCFCLVACIYISSPLVSYAITPLSSLYLQSFEDGPWAGQSVALGCINSNGSITNLGVPSWRAGSSAGSAYYNSVGSFNSGVEGYVFSSTNENRGSVDNIVIWSNGPLDELYVVDPSGSIVANVLEDAFLCNPASNRYFYGVSCHAGAGVAFSSSSLVYFTELSTAFNGGSYYEQIMDSLPYLGGIYDVNSVAVKYPGVVFGTAKPFSLSYGFNYYVFPCMASAEGDANDRISLYIDSSDALLNDDTDYTVRFEGVGIQEMTWTISQNYTAVVSGEQYIVTGKGVGKSLYDTTFGVVRSNTNSPDTFYLRFVQITSDDIGTLPPDDSGDGEGSGSPNYTSALNQIGNRLEDVMAAVSDGSQQIVNNITYQTTEITNTITNTVTNMTQQITQGLQSVQQGITDKLGVVQDGITNKLQNVQDGINNKLESVQEEIVNGYDNSAMESEKSELSGSVEELEQAEKEVMDNVTGYLEDFEYPTFDSISGGVLASIAFIGTFLQSLFLAIGDFGLIITFSLTMIFVLIIVGYHRIRT